MELKVLGSSSKGNCYVLDNGREALVIECGIPFREVQKAVGFNIGRIVGAVVSHEHGDHARHAERFVEAFIPVYMSEGTRRESLKGFKNLSHTPRVMDAGRQYVLGGFTILPFDTQHDAAQPFGFLIYHAETGGILFATDTCYLKYVFSGLSNIMIECNYRQDILDANTEMGIVSRKQHDRVMKSHCSLETCIEILEANSLATVNNILLIHLSDNNSHAEEFKREIARATGKRVEVAEPGMVMDFNKTPF